MLGLVYMKLVEKTITKQDVVSLHCCLSTLAPNTQETWSTTIFWTSLQENGSGKETMEMEAFFLNKNVSLNNTSKLRYRSTGINNSFRVAVPALSANATTKSRERVTVTL